jgi:hypothetical protein
MVRAGSLVRVVVRAEALAFGLIVREDIFSDECTGSFIRKV